VSAIDARFLLDICQSLVRSFNQPNFSANTSWCSNAVSVAKNSTIGSRPIAFFVNTHNTLFVAHPQNGRILLWRNESLDPTTTIPTNLSYPYSLFVTGDEEIFVDNENLNKRVERLTSNGTQLPSPMSICLSCSGLFVDSNDDIYCDDACLSLGIFVTETFNLYVADFLNDRIQLCRLGEINATTVVGNGSNETTITLNKPSGVVLDGNGYLFIADRGNHRILGSGPWGFRCVAGCSGSFGSATDQLSNPRTMNFDRDGNLFVLDTGNDRIQKFFLATNSCVCESKWQEIA
jgi:hypothetical protein